MTTENRILEEPDEVDQEILEALAEEEAIVAEEEAPAPVAEVTPPPAPEPPLPETPSPETVENARLRQQNIEQERQLQQFQAAQDRQQLDQQQAQYQEQLEAQGHLPEHAQTLASQARQAHEQTLRVQRSSDLALREQEAKGIFAMRTAEKYGVLASELMQYATPSAMEKEAKSQSEIKALRDKVTRLEQAQVPPSDYDEGRNAANAPSGYENRMERLMRKSEWTDADNEEYRKLIAGT